MRSAAAFQLTIRRSSDSPTIASSVDSTIPISRCFASSASRRSVMSWQQPLTLRPSIAVQWIRKRHPDLCHAIPFEEDVPADLLPSIEHDSRKRRGSAHHQPQRVAPARA